MNAGQEVNNGMHSAIGGMASAVVFAAVASAQQSRADRQTRASRNAAVRARARATVATRTASALRTEVLGLSAEVDVLEAEREDLLDELAQANRLLEGFREAVRQGRLVAAQAA